METYLKVDYDCFEDEKYLKTVNDIERYFKDNGRDWLECGQGYSQNEASIFCKVGDKFYNVYITAEIGSEWQDRGDRLYFVDSITNVEYEEVEKPLPKDRKDYKFTINLSEVEHDNLLRYLISNNILYKLKQ